MRATWCLCYGMVANASATLWCSTHKTSHRARSPSCCFLSPFRSAYTAPMYRIWYSDRRTSLESSMYVLHELSILAIKFFCLTHYANAVDVGIWCFSHCLDLLLALIARYFKNIYQYAYLKCTVVLLKLWCYIFISLAGIQCD